jgi:hypothetical protein
VIGNPVSIAQSASQYKILETGFAANATVQKCIGANPNRVAIMFSDASGNCYVSIGSGNVGNNKGALFLTTNQPNAFFTFDQCGPWVQSEFFCCRLTGTSTLTITEIIYSPSG